MGILSVSSLPAASATVEYYGTLVQSVLITNNSTEAVLIEEVSLRFQSDRAQGSLLSSVRPGVELEAGAILECDVNIVPNALFLANTNMYDVSVRFRSRESGVFDASEFEILPSASYIVVREPPATLGEVFISVKQPEDESLGRLFEDISRRAGFAPFLKASNPHPGEDFWTDVIEPHLRSSIAALIIWTPRTEYGTGVQREVQFCRDNGIRDTLLLERDHPVPPPYRGSSIEREVFDPADPGHAFLRVVESLRRARGVR
jgi:hypothetical protein